MAVFSDIQIFQSAGEKQEVGTLGKERISEPETPTAGMSFDVRRPPISGVWALKSLPELLLLSAA